MRLKRTSWRRTTEKPISGWLLLRGARDKHRKRVLRATMPIGFSRSLTISLRRFKTAPHRRSARFRQFVWQARLLSLLTFRELAIAIKPRRRKATHRLMIKPAVRLTDQVVLSLVLIIAGATGSLHFGTNLKSSPHLFIASSGSESVSQHLSKNTDTIASEIKHSAKVDLIKPAAEVKSVPQQPPAPQVLSHSIPERIRIPKIDLDTSLLPTGLGPSGTIAMPEVFDQAMWYDQSPTPGERGPSVITGHVDSPHNIAIFWRLRELLPGDTVQIDRQDGTTATFVVTDIKQYAQDQFPTQEVYGNTDYAGLRLITCGGTFNTATGHYSHNTVVYGKLQL